MKLVACRLAVHGADLSQHLRVETGLVQKGCHWRDRPSPTGMPTLILQRTELSEKLWGGLKLLQIQLVLVKNTARPWRARL